VTPGTRVLPSPLATPVLPGTALGGAGHLTAGTLLGVWRRWSLGSVSVSSRQGKLARGGLLGVTARGVDSTDLDEQTHQHNSSNCHQKHRPPVDSDPVFDLIESLVTKEKVLKSGQRSVLIDSTTLLKYIAVASIVITGHTSRHPNASEL